MFILFTKIEAISFRPTAFTPSLAMQFVNHRKNSKLPKPNRTESGFSKNGKPPKAHQQACHGSFQTTISSRCTTLADKFLDTLAKIKSSSKAVEFRKRLRGGD